MITYIDLRKSYLQILFLFTQPRFACSVYLFYTMNQVFPVSFFCFISVSIMSRMRFQMFWKVEHFETLGYTGNLVSSNYISQKMKFSIMGFGSKCDQIRSKLRISSHLLKNSLMENFIFYTLLTSEVYLKTWQRSIMEVFCETS